MHRIYQVIAIFICLTACDNTIDIDAPFEEVTYVYALLDASDTIHYIRIEKSFLQTGVSALELAKDPANLYYQKNDLTVTINALANGIVQSTWNLEQVDGDTLGIFKDEGDFAHSPNILYRFSAVLDTDAVYQLAIINHNSGDTISAETVLVHPFQALFPTPSLAGINFVDTGEIYYICRSAINAKMYDLKLTFHYAETNLASGATTNKNLEWLIFKNVKGDNLIGSGNIAYPLRANTFFLYIRSLLEANNTVFREFTSIDFTYYAGGIEMYLLYLNFLANLGINELYNFTEYTNIKNGYGIFSSRYSVEIPGLTISSESIDSLACGIITGHLGFYSSPFNQAYPNCD